jgi:hypothetical protein
MYIFLYSYSNLFDIAIKENIPPQFRTIQGIVKFTLKLLPSSSSLYRIENVTFLRHHQDTPDDIPKCKGFALVTLSHMQDVELFLKDWPWNRNQGSEQRTKEGEEAEAAKYGFRTLSKHRWDQLQEEYLTQRQRIIDAINTPKDTHIGPSSHPPPLEGHADLPPLDTSAPYPPGCLIFVRNVHPETNKTTLRKLFSSAFKDLDGGSKEGLDYVDFNKGMNSVSSPYTSCPCMYVPEVCSKQCHLRLTTSARTTALHTYFKTNSITQSFGLDDVGVPSSSGDGITMEIISAKKEQLYWEKVPEKVRQQAVQRAIQNQSDSSVGMQGGIHDSECDQDGDRRKRKRKRDK